jgi:signal transduction histidine kinase
LSVSDEGNGVAESEKERIWSAFARAKTSTGAAGSGIGLTIVHDVVVQNGGRVHVEDEPGGGARFVVSLPAVSIVTPVLSESDTELATR